MKTNSSALIIPPAPPASTNATAGADIRDIKGPVEIPNNWAWLAWTLGGVLLALAAFLAARYWLNHRKSRRSPEIIIPPHVRARNRLHAALQLIHEPKPFCVAVSDALRVYLEERFDYRAPERTTDEFLDELQASPLLAAGQKRWLGDFLTRCDLVKFAKFEPTETELRELYDSALRLVEETAASAMAAPTPAQPLTRPSGTLSPSDGERAGVRGHSQQQESSVTTTKSDANQPPPTGLPPRIPASPPPVIRHPPTLP